MATTLLALGDLHLGRRPSRLPASLQESCSPARAWERCVELALAERVSAVLLAGDVVDDERDRFEAYALLAAGAERLTAAGIAVVAVAGNHDGHALPRLCERLPAVRLLGVGGTWELLTLNDEVELLGWSFPNAHHRQSPALSQGLETLPPRTPGRARLGLLHADLDASESPYAPLPRAAAAALPVDALLLGHLHRPDPLTGTRPLGYLGCVVGLDPSETGAHGPWLVTVDDGAVSLSQRPLGAVRWEERALTAPLAGFASADDLHEWLQQHIVAAMDGADPLLEVLALRLRVVGPVERPLGPWLNALPVAHLERRRLGRSAVVTDLIDDTRPALDLDALARQPGPLGILAGRLLADDAGEPLPDELSAALTRALAPLGEGRWALPDRAPLDLQLTARRATVRLLELLVAQQRGRS